MRLHLVGHLLAPDDLGLRHVIVEDGRVRAIGPAGDGPPDALGGADAVITPGLVDIQLNGAAGEDFSDPGADLPRAAAALPATGVTAFLATIVSSPPETYVPAMRNLAGSTPAGSARLLGIHVEGPYISDARRGTHDPAVLRPPDRAEVASWLEAGPVRIVTLAPELPGALELVAELTAKGVIVSIGHSDATWDEADAAIAAGARLGTHLFNAMRPFHHREAGIAGRLLASNVTASVVVDGVHLAPETVRLVTSIKHPDELVFITDAMAALAMPPGRYPLSTREVISDGVSARLPDGTLSGSVAPMASSLGRLVAAGLDPVVAVRAASTTPAGLLGAGDRLGRIEVGRVADLIVMDAAWNPMLTLVQGSIGHGKSAELASAFNGMADRLERSELLRRRAASDLARDLATPATVLESQLEAMVDGVVPPDAAELEKARAAATSLSSVIGQLGELTQAESAPLHRQTEPVDLSELGTEVLAALEGLLRERGVTGVVQGAPVRVQADRAQLGRALRNIVTNAIQHAPAGSGVRIETGRSGGSASLRVTDEGPGIAWEDLPFVFERFYRADRSRGTIRGSGIGLTVARELVAANGGSLAVESTGPDGTTFVLTLPAV